MGYEVVDTGIRLYVRDTGIGIPEEKKRKVFHRFEKLMNLHKAPVLDSLYVRLLPNRWEEVSVLNRNIAGDLFSGLFYLAIRRYKCVRSQYRHWTECG